jgi:hypothetical protein
MTVFKKIFIFSALISIIFFLITGLTYVTLIKKPSNLIFLVNQLSKNSYDIKYQSADSNINFLSPDINFAKVTVTNFNNQEIFKAEKLGLELVLFRL